MNVNMGEASVIFKARRAIATFLVCVTTYNVSAKSNDANATLADAKCVAVGMKMGKLNTQQQRDAGSALSIYYLGRLDRHLEKADVERLIREQAAKMTSEEFRVQAVRCGKELSTRGQEIAKINAALVSEFGTTTN